MWRDSQHVWASFVGAYSCQSCGRFMGKGDEMQTNIRVVRPMGRGVLGQEEKNFVPLPITDDRDLDYIDPRLRDVADLVLRLTSSKP